jgi:hypothetical protein
LIRKVPPFAVHSHVAVEAVVVARRVNEDEKRRSSEAKKVTLLSTVGKSRMDSEESFQCRSLIGGELNDVPTPTIVSDI